MPVTVHADIRRLSQAEFGQIAFEVMRHVFAVHNELGCCCREDVYQRAIAHRCGGQREVAVDVVYGAFEKRYFLDLLVADGGLFELKAVDLLTPQQRGQLLNYLLLTGLGHGKLVNLRTPNVQHEFVNTSWTVADRIAFAIDSAGWDFAAAGAADLESVMVALARDLGAGLSLPLYHEALIQLLGGEAAVVRDVAVMCDGRQVGSERLPHAGSGAAFRVSAFEEGGLAPFGDHLQRFLLHTPLDVMHWININVKCITFATLHRGERLLLERIWQKNGG